MVYRGSGISFFFFFLRLIVGFGGGIVLDFWEKSAEAGNFGFVSVEA